MAWQLCSPSPAFLLYHAPAHPTCRHVHDLDCVHQGWPWEQDPRKARPLYNLRKRYIPSNASAYEWKYTCTHTYWHSSTSFPDCCIQSLFQSQQLAKSPNCTEVLRLLAQDRYLGTQARLPVNMKEPDDEATGLHVWTGVHQPGNPGNPLPHGRVPPELLPTRLSKNYMFQCIHSLLLFCVSYKASMVRYTCGFSVLPIFIASWILLP